MKHGIYYAYWEKEWAADYEYYVEKVARLGFDILELGAAPLPDYTPAQIRSLKACAEKNGIELTAGYGPTSDHNMASSDPAVVKGAVEWYKRLFDVMAQLGIHLIGGALYSYWPVEFDGIDKAEDWKRSVEGMQTLAPIAKQYDINLGMEVLNRFENHRRPSSSFRRSHQSARRLHSAVPALRQPIPLCQSRGVPYHCLA